MADCCIEEITQRRSGISGGDKTGLAEERTEFAEDRTLLAHERSFAGWLRTGMAAVGLGLGFNALFQTLQPPWVPRALASMFLAFAVYVFVSAERRAAASMAQLDAHRLRALKPVRMQLLAVMLSSATIGLGVAIWLLPAR